MARPAECRTTADVAASGAIKAAPGWVYWITASETAGTARTVKLDDSTAGGGTIRWSVSLKTDSVHAVFDPPIYCSTGIYLTIGGATVNSIGYD